MRFFDFCLFVASRGLFDDVSKFFLKRYLFVDQFIIELTFLNHDILKMTFISIMWIDIKFCSIFAILSSFSFELNFRRCDLNIFINVSFIVCESVDEFSSELRRHSYAKRWSIKFWLKSLSINAKIRTLFVEITKIIDAHKWKFFFTRFRIVNMWIMSIDFYFFSTICWCRHCDIKIYNALLCHKCSKLYATNSSLNELSFALNLRWLLSSIACHQNFYFWSAYY